MKRRTPVQGISTEKSPGSKSRKVGSERTGAGLPEDLTWAHHDTVHTGTCTHSGTHAAEAVNNWWSCRYLVDAKAPGRKKKFCWQLPNRAGCFSVCVHDTSSHAKRTGCLSHRVTQRQRMRAQTWEKCELITASDWFGLQQGWGHPQRDWLAPNSEEKSSPFLSFHSCSAAGRGRVCVGGCTYGCVCT